MIVKYYDYESFVKQKGEELLQNRFAISNNTYQKILKGSNTEFISLVLNNRDKFDICHVGGHGMSVLPTELYLAVYYDKLCHPDEVIFVTSDSHLADVANRYFGTDSIILLK